MRTEDLIKPLSPDAPCGDDLLAADDPDYVDYYFNVEDRLPTSYFNVVRDTLFDSKSVDLKAEIASVDALLKRSRDLRLLGIEAKFQILAGRFKGFVEAVQSMAALLETYPEEVHPVDPLDRRNAIEELNSNATIVAPLEYVSLITDKRIGEVSYRAFGTGSGKITPREGEDAGNSSNINSALGSSENAKVVDTLFEQLTSLKSALKIIVAVCLAGPKPATPQLGKLDEKLTDLLQMVLDARPDLAGSASPETTEGADGNAIEGNSPGARSSSTITLFATPADVPDHRAAFRLLQCVEKYFVSTEPASLALLLVVQARLLVGRPLVESLDVLMEGSMGYASVTFGADTGFSISMSRLRDLSQQANIPEPDTFIDEAVEETEAVEDYYETESETDVEADDSPDDDQATDEEALPQEGEGSLEVEAQPDATREAISIEQAVSKALPGTVVILSRDHAGLMLKQVEEFFQIREPASPIPILLFKARNLLAKDFHALVRELLPPST
jgi:type VI secretion system protein ImpA